MTIDNDCSEMFTVIDVFAMDKPGLLYTLAAALYQLGLSVELTRIATNIDQVVDVFYVVDKDGRKIESPEELERIHGKLTHELLEFQNDTDAR